MYIYIYIYIYVYIYVYVYIYIYIGMMLAKELYQQPFLCGICFLCEYHSVLKCIVLIHSVLYKKENFLQLIFSLRDVITIHV